MKINGIKIWYDTEIHPDNIENSVFDSIKALPFFEESYGDGEHFYAAFWVDHPDQIPIVEQNLREVLGVLV